MADKKNNYCQLLGLNPLKESSYKLESILKKIETKKGKWENESRNKQNDTEQRFKAQKLVEATVDMKRVMSDPMLRRKEFKDGELALKGKAQKLRMDCVILTDGKYLVLPGTADPFVKKLHWEGVTKADVLKLAGISEGNPPKPVSDKVLNAYRGLRNVDVYSPIDLLNNLITHPRLEINLDPLSDGSSFSQMRTAFDVCDKRVNSVRPDVLPEQDSYIQSLRSLKLVLDDKELANLIAYGKCNRALVPIMDTIEQEYNGQQLTRKYIDDLMRMLTTSGINRDMAIQILQAFCYKKKIAANFSNSDSEMKRCPECGYMVQAGPETLYCPSCGKTFKTICPACSTAQEASNTLCIKCGFNFKEGMAKAKGLELNIKQNLQKGFISKAEKDLDVLKGTYAGYTSLGVLQGLIAKAKAKADSMAKIINEAYSAKKYCEVKNACETLVEQFPEIMKDDPGLKHKYEEACNHYEAADLYCSKAALADSKDRTKLYVNAIGICPDHPTAKAKLRDMPPQSPIDAYGKVTDDGIMIKFTPPAESENVTYCIYREKGSLPSNINEDTRPLVEIPTTFYQDKSIEPGVEYYYSVYSKRWGVLSRESTHYGPLVILSEVDKVHIEPIEGGLRLMYEKPRGCTRVRIWRCEDGREGEDVEIMHNDEPVYDDIGLKGGKLYHYLFVAEYESRSKIQRTEGKKLSEMTLKPPQPVRDIEVRRNVTDGSFTVRWNSDEHVDLYTSPKRIVIPGNLVKMEDINSWMTKVEPIQEYVDGVRVMLPDGAVQYMYPIIPRGKMGVKGNEIRITNVKPFRDVEKAISNRDCIITMIWPPEAVEAKIVVSNTGVKGLEDNNAEVVIVRREEYEADKMIRIPMGRSVKKYLNIFAIYNKDNESIPSRGMAIEVYSSECKKVRYTVKEDRSGVIIDLETESSVTALPQIIAVQVDVGIPLKRADGEVVWRSDSAIRLTDGKCTFRIPAGAIRDVKLMRLFFEDEENYNMFRFIHPLYKRRG